MELILETPKAKMKFDLKMDDIAFITKYALEHAGEAAPKAGMEKRERLAHPVRRSEGYAVDPRGHRGFLLIKCRGCGKVKGFSTKTELTEFSCDCGAVTDLGDLIPAYLDCSCGSHFRYKTNVRDSILTWSCLNCSNAVDMRLNDKETAYVTINHVPSYYQKGQDTLAI